MGKGRMEEKFEQGGDPSSSSSPLLGISLGRSCFLSLILRWFCKERPLDQIDKGSNGRSPKTFDGE